MPGGRPTKYKPEYCEMLIEHMQEGLSFASFAGVIGVSFDTLYEWAKVHTEFSEAKHIGSGASILYWEKMGRAGASGGLKGFNYGAWFRNIANRFPNHYREKVEVVTRDESLKNPQTMSDEELSDRITHALQVIEQHEKANGSKSSKGSATRAPKKTAKKTKDRSRKDKSD